MNYITKIFHGEIDAIVHSQFIRYSIGDYVSKAVVKIHNGTTAKIVTGFEYVNDFLELLGEYTKGDIQVTGKIFLKKMMTAPFSLTKKKGYFVADINETIPAKKIKEWVNAYGAEGYLLLNVQGEDLMMKTKNAPHNPKGKYDEAFCKVTVKGPLKDVFLKDILFDAPAGKKIEIKHQLMITEIIIPKEYENDMALARIHAKRKGKIIRTVVVDGKEIVKEMEFMA